MADQPENLILRMLRQVAAKLDTRMDRFDRRVLRIERRLDLIEA